MSTERVAVVTGSSSGIGYATSLMLARKGFYTYASVRNISRSSSLEYKANAEKLPLKLIQLDVTDVDSVKDAIEKIVSEKGRIDVLVNNAGALGHHDNDGLALFYYQSYYHILLSVTLAFCSFCSFIHDFSNWKSIVVSSIRLFPVNFY